MNNNNKLLYLPPVYHLSSDIIFCTCIIHAPQHSKIPAYLILSLFSTVKMIWSFPQLVSREALIWSQFLSFGVCDISVNKELSHLYFLWKMLIEFKGEKFTQTNTSSARDNSKIAVLYTRTWNHQDYRK